MSSRDGGTAFPTLQRDWVNPATINNDGTVTYAQSGTIPAKSGMSLRDYFAARCMQGIISNDAGMNRLVDSYPHELPMDVVARTAYKQADCMLRARSVNLLAADDQEGLPEGDASAGSHR